MNQSIHQLLQVILYGISWVLRAIEALWVWSWSQITHAFDMSLWNLPPWKIVVGRFSLRFWPGYFANCSDVAWQLSRKMAAALWAMTLTLFGVLTIVAIVGVFLRRFQWVVTTVPDKFWENFL